MNDQITSPNQMNDRIKITKHWMWIVLICILLVCVLMIIVLLNYNMPIRERHTCFVSDDVKKADEALLEIYNNNFSGVEFSLDEINSWYGDRVNCQAQSAMIFIPESEMGKYDIVEDIEVKIDDYYGTIVFISSRDMSPENLADVGISYDNLIKNGISTKKNYYILYILIELDDKPALKSGFYNATIKYDEISLYDTLLKKQ